MEKSFEVEWTHFMRLQHSTSVTVGRDSFFATIVLTLALYYDIQHASKHYYLTGEKYDLYLY